MGMETDRRRYRLQVAVCPQIRIFHMGHVGACQGLPVFQGRLPVIVLESPGKGSAVGETIVRAICRME